MRQLTEAQIESQQSLKELRHTIKKQIQRLSSYPKNERASHRTQIMLNRIQLSIEENMDRLKSKIVHISFWERLQMETEQQYRNGSFKKFIENALLKLSQNEALSIEGDKALVRTFNFAGWSVRNNCHEKENPVQCISESFNDNTIMEPPLNPPVQLRRQAKTNEPTEHQVRKSFEDVLKKFVKTTKPVKTGQLEKQRKESDF